MPEIAIELTYEKIIEAASKLSEDDKERLFFSLNKDYSKEEYIEQFTIKINFLLEKLNRMEKMYKTEKEIPKFFWDTLFMQRSRLNGLLKKTGKKEINPFELV